MLRCSFFPPLPIPCTCATRMAGAHILIQSTERTRIVTTPTHIHFSRILEYSGRSHSLQHLVASTSAPSLLAKSASPPFLPRPHSDTIVEATPHFHSMSGCPSRTIFLQTFAFFSCLCTPATIHISKLSSSNNRRIQPVKPDYYLASLPSTSKFWHSVQETLLIDRWSSECETVGYPRTLSLLL